MDAIARFANEQNITRFTDQLCSETDLERQQTLRQLLLEEEYRFGFYSEQVDIAQRLLSEGRTRIVKQELLIADLKENGNDISEANRLLDLFLGIQGLFEKFRLFALESLDRNKL